MGRLHTVIRRDVRLCHCTEAISSENSSSSLPSLAPSDKKVGLSDPTTEDFTSHSALLHVMVRKKNPRSPLSILLLIMIKTEASCAFI